MYEYLVISGTVSKVHIFTVELLIALQIPLTGYCTVQYIVQLKNVYIDAAACPERLLTSADV